MNFILIIAVVVLFVLFFRLKNKIDTISDGLGRKAPESYGTGTRIENIMQEQSAQPKRFTVGSDMETSGQGERSETVKKKALWSEYALGAKIFPAVGILSIFIGVAFFLRDYLVLGEEIRVALGFFCGMGFVFWGDKLRVKYPKYSALLLGGGVSILYISAFFGLEYGMYQETTAFALMAAVTIAAITFAYKLDSRVVGLVALVGGFATPLVVAMDQANEWVLFNYIVLLLGGMLFLAWKKGWGEVVTLSLVGTLMLYVSSFIMYYEQSVFWIYWTYLIIFFAVFTAVPFLLYLAENSKEAFFKYTNLVATVIMGGVFLTISYDIWIFSDMDFVIALIPALLYIYLAKVAISQSSESGDSRSMLSYLFVALASFAIAMIPALQFSGVWITLAWFIEALVLALITFKTNMKIFLNLSLPMLLVAVLRLFFEDSYVEVKEYFSEIGQYVTTFTPILNDRFVVFFVGSSVMFTVAYVFFKQGNIKRAKAIGVMGNILVLSWISMELFSVSSAGYISSDFASLLLSLSFLFYAVALMYMGVKKDWSGFRIFSIFVFGFVIVKTYLVDVYDLSDHWRIVAFVLLGTIILSIGMTYNKNKELFKELVKKTK